MPNDLTAARLRELIAKATPGPWTMGEFFYPTCTVATMHSDTSSVRVNTGLGSKEKPSQNAKANAEFIAYLATHAPALADAMEKVKIYEEALIAIDRGRGGCEETHCWNVAEQALIRAAKESADAK